jgi:TPR repeat protein
MKKYYSLFQEYMAYGLLISLCLQSCGGGLGNNPLIPTSEEQVAPIQTYTQATLLPTNIQPLVDKQLIAQGGHTVTFYEEANQLKADVEMNLPQGFSKTYEGLSVTLEQGAELAQLPCLDVKAQERRIRLQLTKGEQPAKVMIYKGAGLAGGMLEGEEEAEEIATELEDAETQHVLGMMYRTGIGIERNYAKAAEWITKAAEQGYIEAQVSLAYMYQNGEGVECNPIKAIEWFTKAANQGDLNAQYNLGVIYQKGKGVEKDYNRAAEWYTKAAEQGDAEAQNRLAIMYQTGEGVNQDEVKAFEWYEKAAEQGLADAQTNLAYMYEDGTGTERDYAKAFEWYTKAAEQGNIAAQNNLGDIYRQGLGIIRDYGKAIEWYEKAANQGHVIPQKSLGDMYYKGQCIERDYGKALEWYTKAAKQGLVVAQAILGDMYYHGKGTECDYGKAFKWYIKAAKQGCAAAQFSLGVMYLKGETVKKDYGEALEWFTKSAIQGHAEAQFSLGVLYQSPLGGKADSRKAVEWYTKAAKQGHVNAQKSLGDIYMHGKGVNETLSQAIQWMIENDLSVECDYTKALKWYTKAANQGDAEAQKNIGDLYLNGLGVDRDITQATYWFMKAKSKQSLLEIFTINPTSPSINTTAEKEIENIEKRLLCTWQEKLIHSKYDTTGRYASFNCNVYEKLEEIMARLIHWRHQASKQAGVLVDCLVFKNRAYINSIEKLQTGAGAMSCVKQHIFQGKPYLSFGRKNIQLADEIMQDIGSNATYTTVKDILEQVKAFYEKVQREAMDEVMAIKKQTEMIGKEEELTSLVSNLTMEEGLVETAARKLKAIEDEAHQFENYYNLFIAEYAQEVYSRNRKFQERNAYLFE